MFPPGRSFKADLSSARAASRFGCGSQPSNIMAVMAGTAAQTPRATRRPANPEPRWPASLALLAVAGLRFALPESLSAGPNWLLLALVVLLVIPTYWSRRAGRSKLSRILGYTVTGVVTLDMIWSLWLL